MAVARNGKIDLSDIGRITDAAMQAGGGACTGLDIRVAIELEEERRRQKRESHYRDMMRSPSKQKANRRKARRRKK